MMKKISAVLGLFFSLFQFYAQAQAFNGNQILPYRLGITNKKTTNLIFPYAIKSVDRGTKEILVQKAAGVENVLQVKAARQGFEETNLTVITADGSLYSYLLNYSASPSGINIKAENPQVGPSPVAVFSENATTDRIKQGAEEVAERSATFRRVRDQNNGIIFQVKGIYMQDSICYLQLFLQNKSIIDYDIKMLACYIRDKKRSRRTASQEVAISPLFTLGNTSAVRAHSEGTIVLALPKFTIPDQKQFQLQIMEENGGRHLQLHLNNKAFMKARAL